MKKFNVIMILLVFVVQCYGETGDSFKDIWARKKLTGDWCGLRSDLTEQGINIDVRMTNYYQAVTSGGIGKVFHVGKQAVNASLRAYHNIEAPRDGADWQLQFQLTFLFPK